MRVKLNDGWRNALAELAHKNRKQMTFFLGRKKEYVVYGLSWHPDSEIYPRPVTLCEVVDDDGNLVSVPIDVFEIVDSNISSTWHVERNANSVLMWPREFLEKFFFDDLSEGKSGALAAFEHVRDLIGRD